MDKQTQGPGVDRVAGWGRRCPDPSSTPRPLSPDARRPGRMDHLRLDSPGSPFRGHRRRYSPQSCSSLLLAAPRHLSSALMLPTPPRVRACRGTRPDGGRRIRMSPFSFFSAPLKHAMASSPPGGRCRAWHLGHVVSRRHTVAPDALADYARSTTTSQGPLHRLVHGSGQLGALLANLATKPAVFRESHDNTSWLATLHTSTRRDGPSGPRAGATGDLNPRGRAARPGEGRPPLRRRKGAAWKRRR